MPVLQTSDLKQHAGDILDAARHSPQYIMREGQLFVLCPIEPPAPGDRNLPEGWFSAAYQNWPKEREALEAASAAVNVGSEERDRE